MWPTCQEQTDTRGFVKILTIKEEGSTNTLNFFIPCPLCCLWSTGTRVNVKERRSSNLLKSPNGVFAELLSCVKPFCFCWNAKTLGRERKKKPKNATGDSSAAILHLPSKSRRGRKESQGAFKVPPVVDATTPNLYNQRKKKNKMDTWLDTCFTDSCLRVWGVSTVGPDLSKAVHVPSIASIGALADVISSVSSEPSDSRSSRNLPGCRKAPVSSRRVPLGGFSQMTEMTGTLLWHSQTTAKRPLNNSHHLTTAT